MLKVELNSHYYKLQRNYSNNFTIALDNIKSLKHETKKMRGRMCFRHYLTNIEKFENFHFETERSVDQDEDEVCDFGNVDHHIDVIRTFYKCEATLLPRNDGHRTLNIRDGLSSEVLY